MTKLKKVAVYGTLKRGLSNHRLLETSKKVGEGLVHFNTMSTSGFPLIDIDETNKSPNLIEVEIYEVDENTFRRLDLLEGHPDFYTRIKVKTTEGEEVSIYTIKPGEDEKDNFFKRNSTLNGKDVKIYNWN